MIIRDWIINHLFNWIDEYYNREHVANLIENDVDEFAIKFSEYCALYSYKNRNMYGEMLHAPTKYDDLYTTKELLEKFKKHESNN